MATAEACEKVGKFEFTVAVSDKKPDSDRRVNVLANWLLAESERVRNPVDGEMRTDDKEETCG